MVCMRRGVMLAGLALLALALALGLLRGEDGAALLPPSVADHTSALTAPLWKEPLPVQDASASAQDLGAAVYKKAMGDSRSMVTAAEPAPASLREDGDFGTASRFGATEQATSTVSTSTLPSFASTGTASRDPAGPPNASVALEGRWFAWCHDGLTKNGNFWFMPGGKIKGDLKGWGLGCWQGTGPLQVRLSNCQGGNFHNLHFNCQLTGFFCSEGKQRGYVEGHGFASPADALAPSSAGAPDCSREASITTPPPMAVRPDCNIFTFWDYPNGPPLFARLNLESWRRHSHQRCNEPILIDNRNVRTYIPDMPDEFFRMPYVAAKSDAIRYALLYHHGGIYLDSDFIVVEDMDPIIDLLNDYDIISYASSGSTACDGGHFSSNFMAGRRGSAVHKAIWEAQKAKMTQHCPLREKTLEKVCCFDDVTEVCHIPWAGLGEWVSHATLRKMQSRKPPPKTYCFTNERSFVPEQLGHILGHMFSPESALAHFRRHRIENGHGRMMYHLFNAQFPFKDFSCKRLFDNKTLASFFYLRSFSTGYGSQRVPRSSATHELYALHPVLEQHDADYGNGRPCLEENTVD